MRWLGFIVCTLSTLFVVSGVVMQKEIKEAFYTILIMAACSFIASVYSVSKEVPGEYSLRIVLGSGAFFMSVLNFLHYASYI